MADKQFSLDDILNEHPRREVAKSDEPFDLDSILAGRNLDKVPPRKTEPEVNKAVTPKEKPVIKEEKPVKTEKPIKAKKTVKSEKPAKAEKPAKVEKTIKAEKPVKAEKSVKIEKLAKEEKPVVTEEISAKEPEIVNDNKKSIFDYGTINPIDYDSSKPSMTRQQSDNKEQSELSKALDGGFVAKKPREQKVKNETLSDAFGKSEKENPIRIDSDLKEFFGGNSGYRPVEEDDDKPGIFDTIKGLFAKKEKEETPAKEEIAKPEKAVKPEKPSKAEEKHHTEIKDKKKLSAKERESSKLREYTAELPTPDDINVDVYSSMMGEPKKKEPVIEIKINKPKRPKEITLEMTGPVLTAEPEDTQKKKKPAQKKEQTGRLSFDNKEVKPLEPHKAAENDNMVENLNRIKKERGQHTAVIPPISRKSISDIDLKLEDKILPNTEPIPIDESASEMQKMRELRERRRKKVNDFVLIGEDDDDTVEIADDGREITDFESIDDAPSVHNDILQFKNSLAVRFIFLVVAALSSGLISLANDFDLPVIEILSKGAQPTTFLFVNIILGLLSAFVCYSVISCGFKKLFKLQADTDTLSAVAIVGTLVSAMVALANTGIVAQGYVNVYISVAIFSLLFNTLGKLFSVWRTEKNFRYIAGDSEHYAVFTVDNEDTATKFTRGALSDFPVLSAMKKTEFVNDFLKNSYAPDISDNFCKIAAPVACGGALLAAILSLIFNRSVEGAGGIFIAFSVFAGTLSLCSCFATIFTVNLPLLKGASKYLESSSAMLSYQSVEDFGDTNSVLLDVSQLFPEGTVTLSSIKVFSGTQVDEAIVQAASLTSHSGSILKHMFYDIIVGKTEMLNPVESYIYEDSMGLCGWINNKRVLLGSRELMINHSIEGMPTAAREREYTENGRSAVYLSISGELSAMFIIDIKANSEVEYCLKEFEKNEVSVMLRTVDSIISINKLSELFGVSPDMFKLLPFRLHNEFEETTSYVPKQSSSLVCNGRFASFASLIIGTKRIRKTANIGLIIQAASGILGLLMALVFAVLSSFPELSPTVVLLYNLAWAGLTVLIQTIRKA
ncbi:MAG: hypothetical protein J5992_04880 [Oscillospiraceae bacterium]|nr:hypothetical protein [Oscillospiraceae bacterium]